MINTNNYIVRKLTRREAVAIYRDIAPAHFPDDELKPVAAIEALYDMDAYLGLGLYENSNPADADEAVNTNETAPAASKPNLLGYALFLTVPGLDTVLLDYYAILEEYRELGLGSFFLQEMRSFYHKTSDVLGILIETEDPAFATDEEELLLRNRRNAFYHKNGALETGVACTLFGVPFQIHFLPTAKPEIDRHSPTELPQNIMYYRQKMETLYRFMLPDSVYNQQVIWR